MSNENEQPLDPGSPRPSRLGKASVVLGLISFAIVTFLGCAFWFLLFFVGESEGWVATLAESSVFVAERGFLASPIASLTGICLAVAGLLRKNCRRGASVAGLILNVISLSVFVLVFFLWVSAIEGMIAC